MNTESGNKRRLQEEGNTKMNEISQENAMKDCILEDEFSDDEHSNYSADPELVTEPLPTDEDITERIENRNKEKASALRITGCWTKAGIASCVLVHDSLSGKEILLDCGYFSPETLKASVVFITHGHIDHVGSCIAHARGRALSKQPSYYFVPDELLSALLQAKAAFEMMDGKEIPMDIIPVKPCTSIEEPLIDIPNFPTLKFRVFATQHRVPSQGYALYSVRKGHLIAELQGCTGAQIMDYKNKYGPHSHLTPTSSLLEIVYTGDTTFNGLLLPLTRQLVFAAPVLLLEMTYLDGDPMKAVTYGHIHIQSIVENANLFVNVKKIILVHISQKYSSSQVIKLLKMQLPQQLLTRTQVSLCSFGVNEVLSCPSDEKWERMERSVAGFGWSHPSGSNRQQYQYNRNNNYGRGQYNNSGRSRGRYNGGGQRNAGQRNNWNGSSASRSSGGRNRWSNDNNHYRYSTTDFPTLPPPP